MEFDWVNLDSGEKVLWSGEPKMNSIYPSVIIGLFLIPVMGVGLLIIAGSYFYLKNTDFVITNRGLYKKTGVLSTNVKRIKFDKVQNTSYTQSFFGNMFEYGNLEISTAGGSGIEMRFNAVENPRELQNIINERIEDRPQEQSEEDTLQQILAELKEINKKL